MAGTVSAGTAGTPELAESRVLGAPPRRGIEFVDEPLGAPDRPEFSPAGGGSELTTSSTTFQTVEEYEAPRGVTPILREVAASVDSNGEIKIVLGGDQWGPFSGALDFSQEWGRAKLPYGGVVRVLARSISGSSTTATGSIVVTEV